MCGICGYISKKRISDDTLIAMNNTMTHRGPDDSGAETYEAGKSFFVGLAQRRLSIIDLSPMGHQPMHSKPEAGTSVSRISLVFNGEIYNFRELREELSDYEFVSNCDTEVIIASYLKWGKKCFDRFNGMYAIAIWDRAEDELILARDRIGKKPLYYWYENSNLVFASELKPIMEHPDFKKKINEKILARFLFQQYIASPDTVFENVYKLEPGTYLCFKSGEISQTKYWDIFEIYDRQAANPITDYDEAKQELKRLLTESVRRRMIADVPIGTFLSGGYDSSLITAIAQSVSSTPVKTFTIGFGDKEYNEAQYAAEVAKHLGTNHTEEYIAEEDMFALVDSIPKYFDEPMADSSQIPTMLVSALAKEKVTVAISGDGGDEFYCGYNVYSKLAKAQKLDGLGRLTNGVCDVLHLKNTGLYSKIPFGVRAIAENSDMLSKSQLSSMYYLDTAGRLVLCKDGCACKYEIEDKIKAKNWQIKRMLVDMKKYLPDDIMCKVDRASMKYSLESRSPILDRDVMEYSFRIPHEFKYKDGCKKYILKDIAYDYIPKSMLERPKKGFSVPLDKWMRGPLRDRLTDYTDTRFLRSQGLFDEIYVKEFVENYLDNGDAGSSSGRNYSRIVWAFFIFQQWYETYMK